MILHAFVSRLARDPLSRASPSRPPCDSYHQCRGGGGVFGGLAEALESLFGDPSGRAEGAGSERAGGGREGERADGLSGDDANGGGSDGTSPSSTIVMPVPPFLVSRSTPMTRVAPLPRQKTVLRPGTDLADQGQQFVPHGRSNDRRSPQLRVRWAVLESRRGKWYFMSSSPPSSPDLKWS